MLKMHEENNVTPYFSNNIRRHCQFRVLKLLSGLAPVADSSTVKRTVLAPYRGFVNVDWFVQT